MPMPTWLARLIRPAQLAVPDGCVCRPILHRDLPRRANLAAGHQAVLVDAGVVQHSIRADHVPVSLKKFGAFADPDASPLVVIWPLTPVEVSAEISGLVSRDGHELSVRVSTRVRVEPVSKSGLVWQALPEAATDLTEGMCEAARDWLMAAAATVDGREAFDEWPRDAGLRAAVRDMLASSLADLGVVDGAADVHVSNDFFEASRARGREVGVLSEDLRAREELSRIKGAIREANARERIAELQHQAQVDSVAAVMLQEARLREIALRRELARADLDSASATVEISRQHMIARFEALSKDAGLSGHEMVQIRGVLHGDPFGRVLGLHSAQVGSRWRIFDGDNLWTISVMFVRWQRHGFLWRRRRPVAAELQILSRPEGRLLRYSVGLNDRHLEIGDGSLACHIERPDDTGAAALRFSRVSGSQQCMSGSRMHEVVHP